MFEVKYIDQRYDGFEATLKVDEDKWIRIDFFLEFFLTGDTKLTKSFKGNNSSYLRHVKYCSEFFKEYGHFILDESIFNFEKYMDWMKNKIETDKALENVKIKPIA